ncbi:HEAT repeat domain-containing protein [Larkinella terrae]|nr:HEAT repeat domain-containing protein [Larkinella terrae]
MFRRDSIYRFLNLQTGEGKTVLLFVVYSLLMGGAVALFFASTTSLFLINFERTQLPIAFIASGSLVYVLGLAVQYLRRKASFLRVNGYLLAFMLLSVAGLLVASASFQNKWVYFALYLWNRVFVFIHGITFWATAGRVFNFGQTKRLLSFISTGDVIASMLSYFSVPLLLTFVSTDDLLDMALVLLVLCVLLMTYIYKRFQPQLTTELPEKAAEKPVAETVAMVSKSYESLLSTLALLTVFGLIYVEFMFTIQSKEVFPNKELLAGFLGIFFGICAVIELFVKSFLYNRLLSAYSIRAGIVMLPVALLVSYSLGAVYGTVYGTTSFFFALIALSRFFLSSVRRSISEPAFQVLFQPIPAAERTLIQSRIEGGPKAIGSILPGIILLILTSFSFITLVHLSYLFLAVLIFWTVVSFRIQPEYRATLNAAVIRSATLAYKKVIGHNLVRPTAERSLSSAQAFSSMLRLAESDNPDDRALAATELGYSGRYYAYTHLLRLLHDDHPLVRKAALSASGALRKPELWPRLFEHLLDEQYRDAATSALLSIGDAVIPSLSRFFTHTVLSTKQQVHIVGIINEMGGEAAIRFLRARINHPVQAVRDAVFEGLNHLNHRATVLERPHILLQLDEQVGLLVWLTAARLDLDSFPRNAPMINALRQEKNIVIPKVFNLLATLYGDNRFDLISQLITRENDEIKSYLIELLGTALPEEVKDRILPLFSDISFAERLRKSSVSHPQQQLSIEERLHDIINKDFNKLTHRLKAVALRELLVWHENDPTAILVANVTSPDELIAETAFYVLKVLNPTRFGELHRILALQSDSDRYRLASRVNGFQSEAELLLYRSEQLEIEENNTQLKSI